MVKTTVIIEGMMCEHCENHVIKAIKGKFKVKKVTCSYIDKKAEIMSKAPLDCDKIKETVENEGYKVISIEEINE